MATLYPSGLTGPVMLAAGGTGGHLFPAQALAEELARLKIPVHLLTDDRATEHQKAFPAQAIHELPSATITVRKPWRWPGQGQRLLTGFMRSRSLFQGLTPPVVVGFGGYPSVPPVLAAQRLGITTVVHEQNAVMGRANRLLSKRAAVVAASFPDIKLLPPGITDRVVVTGNPVRRAVLEKAGAPYSAPAANRQFNLLVFGGSQGARFFSEFMPQAVKALPKAILKHLRLVQQCRPEDIESVRAAYQALDVTAELQPFFTDMPKRIAAAHLVVCRSGASTVAELGVIGRPAILVPLPHALDNDQLRNAETFSGAGAGWVMREGTFDADDVATLIMRLRYQTEELEHAAAAALRVGRPDAAQRLAAEIERLVRPFGDSRPMEIGKEEA